MQTRLASDAVLQLQSAQAFLTKYPSVSHTMLSCFTYPMVSSLVSQGKLESLIQGMVGGFEKMLAESRSTAFFPSTEAKLFRKQDSMSDLMKYAQAFTTIQNVERWRKYLEALGKDENKAGDFTAKDDNDMLRC